MTKQPFVTIAGLPQPATNTGPQAVALQGSILARAILDLAQKSIAEFRVGKYEHELLAAVLLRAVLPILPAETPLKVEEVALALGITTGAVYVMRSKGDLGAVKQGRMVRFPAGAVRDYMDRVYGPNAEVF